MFLRVAPDVLTRLVGPTELCDVLRRPQSERRAATSIGGVNTRDIEESELLTDSYVGNIG